MLQPPPALNLAPFKKQHMLRINLSNGSGNGGAGVTALQMGRLGVIPLFYSDLEWECRDGFGRTTGTSQKF